MKRRFATAALILIPLVACKGNDSKTQAALNDTSIDTSLAHDLALAGSDTVLYAEAADVAMQEDTTTRIVSRGRPPAAERRTAEPGARQTAQAPREQQVSRSPSLEAAATPNNNPCGSPTGADQRRCLMQYLARSDASLNRTYQRVIRESGSGEEGRLRIAQRAWLVYRDTECRRKTRSSEGELWAPIRARCLGEYSAARERELAGMLR